LDGQGLFHIIECKGTQSGAKYLEKQIADGVAQKQSLIFTLENLVAQRLVAGLHIGAYDGSEPSLLIIRDPPPKREQPRLIIETNDVGNIIDPIDRYRIARYLALPGTTLPTAIATPVESPSETTLDRRKFASMGSSWQIRSNCIGAMR
jgi:hypothetical protein